MQYNNDKYVAMLERSLEKARQGKGRSGILMTIKPNGIDQTAEFTDLDDLRAAIVECDKMRANLVDLLDKSAAG